LQDRIAFCNNTAADLCLSVHVNKKPAGSTSVYELGFSNTAAQHQESQLLASAVGNRLQQAGQKICLTDMRAAIVRQNKHTTLLLECGNMDDAAHPAMGSDRDALNTFCRDILAGVVDFAAKK
jgi:N-acetylmuramoyl-L-alanine amidase